MQSYIDQCTTLVHYIVPSSDGGGGGSGVSGDPSTSTSSSSGASSRDGDGGGPASHTRAAIARRATQGGGGGNSKNANGNGVSSGNGHAAVRSDNKSGSSSTANSASSSATAAASAADATDATLHLLECHLDCIGDYDLSTSLLLNIYDVLTSPRIRDDGTKAGEIAALLGFEWLSLACDIVNSKAAVARALLKKLRRVEDIGSRAVADDDIPATQALLEGRRRELALTAARRNAPTRDQICTYPLQAIPDHRAVCAMCLEDFVPARDPRKARGGQNSDRLRLRVEEEPTEHAQVLRVLPCGHILHRDCVDKWLREVRQYCPTCNAPLSGGGAGGSGAVKW